MQVRPSTDEVQTFVLKSALSSAILVSRAAFGVSRPFAVAFFVRRGVLLAVAGFATRGFLGAEGPRCFALALGLAIAFSLAGAT